MSTCSLFFFIDAMGAAVLRGQPAFEDFGQQRALRSVLGYSSACVPSILTGRYPEEHLHWSFFTRAGAHRGLRVPFWVRMLPPALRDRGRVRAKLSPAIARANGIGGYFGVYQMPLHELHRYGHCEPRDIFRPGGINAGTGIADLLRERGTPGWICDVNAPVPSRWAAMERAAADPRTRFLLIYDGTLDGWLHDHGREHPGLGDQLAGFRRRIDAVRAAARAAHDEVRSYVFSDHGMCTVREHREVFPALERSGLAMHRDYLCVVDSTMVRMWYRDERQRATLRDCLSQVRGLRLLDAAEIARERIRFPDDRFGQDIWLADPGVLLVPSHMGLTPLTGMHGYTPEHEDSDAGFVSDDPSAAPRTIVDLYGLMAAAA